MAVGFGSTKEDAMLKQLQALIDASQPPAGGDSETPPHRRDAYPLRVVLAIVVLVSIVVIILRGCAAVIP